MREHDGPGTHRQFENMAVEHVLGGLDSDQGRLFRSHLLECALCRARVGELRAIASDLAGVERDERRQHNARAVETKRRHEEERPEEEQPARPRVPPRWVLLALVVALVGLGTYTLVLRGNYLRQQDALATRLAASAALEHGEELETVFMAPDAQVTAKVHADGVVVLLDGADDGTRYDWHVDDDDARGGDEPRVGGGPLQVSEGRVLQLLDPLPASADRLVITATTGTLPPQRILEAVLSSPSQPPARIGAG